VKPREQFMVVRVEVWRGQLIASREVLRTNYGKS
jgi:hypothetical protein